MRSRHCERLEQEIYLTMADQCSIDAFDAALALKEKKKIRREKRRARSLS